jgi:hypothetical protein
MRSLAWLIILQFWVFDFIRFFVDFMDTEEKKKIELCLDGLEKMFGR